MCSSSKKRGTQLNYFLGQTNTLPNGRYRDDLNSLN